MGLFINLWNDASVTLNETWRNSSFLSTFSILTGSEHEMVKCQKEVTVELEKTFHEQLANCENTSDVKFSTLTSTVDTKNWDIEMYKQNFRAMEKNTHKACSYIIHLESKVDKLTKLAKDSYQMGIQKMANRAQLIIDENDTSRDKIVQMKIRKYLNQNPPPLVSKIQYSSSMKLLIYLNENFEEYCQEMCLESLKQKCMVIHKIFSENDAKALDLKERTKLFLRMNLIQELIETDKISSRELYVNLVQYILSKPIEFELNTRKKGTSFTVFLDQYWTFKSIAAQLQHKSESKFWKKYLKIQKF